MRRARGGPAAALAAAAVVGMASLAGFQCSAGHAPRRHVVEIRGMDFHPRELEVSRGDTVVWINRDIVPHTATSTRSAEWNTGPLRQGESGRYVPGRAGEEPYICHLHPVMLGKLIVR